MKETNQPASLGLWSLMCWALPWLILNAAQAQTTNYSLGTAALLEGPAAGSDSVVLAVNPPTGSWTAATSVTWLHLNTANQNGAGSTNVVFTYDANPGVTRSGNLTIAGLTLNVTQAGATYVAAGAVIQLANSGSGLSRPVGVAVDAAGNVYVADWNEGAIYKWTAAINTFTLLISAGLFHPGAVAVDGVGNVYIADTLASAIKMWTAANSNVTVLVSSGLDQPDGVAVDGAGNVYFSDTGNNAVKKWTAVDDSVTTLVSSGLNVPVNLSVDLAGNLYIADWGNNAIKELTAANNTVTTLVSSGLSLPIGVSVDGAGNVYIADTGNNAIKVWTAGDNTVTALAASGLNQPLAIAADRADNVYIADPLNSALEELPHAFVDPTAKLESCAAGSDVLPVVLPATANLLAPFAPTSDETWLTITGITNGVVSFSVAANTGPPRIGFISLLGQTIPIVQVSSDAPLDLICVPTGGKGSFQLAFGGTQNGSFTVLSTTNLFLPMKDWAVIGTASNIGPNLFEFTDPYPATNIQRYYRVRSP